MTDEPNILGAGDSSDLAWLDARADETSRALHAAFAETDRLRAIAQTEPEGASKAEATRLAIEAVVQLPDLETAAYRAKQARDDAYAAQEALLEPPAQTFASVEEGMQWVHLMYENLGEADERYEAACAELESLPDPYEQALAAEGEEQLRLLEQGRPIIDRRIDLLLAMKQASKDYDAAKAAIDRIVPPKRGAVAAD